MNLCLHIISVHLWYFVFFFLFVILFNKKKNTGISYLWFSCHRSIPQNARSHLYLRSSHCIVFVTFFGNEIWFSLWTWNILFAFRTHNTIFKSKVMKMKMKQNNTSSYFTKNKNNFRWFYLKLQNKTILFTLNNLAFVFMFFAVRIVMNVIITVRSISQTVQSGNQRMMILAIFAGVCVLSINCWWFYLIMRGEFSAKDKKKEKKKKIINK